MMTLNVEFLKAAIFTALKREDYITARELRDTLEDLEYEQKLEAKSFMIKDRSNYKQLLIHAASRY